MAWDDFLSSGYFGAGAAGVGGLADLYAAINNARAREQQQKIFDITSNPNKLSAYVQQYYRPMSAGENQAIRRDIGSAWAPMTGGATGGALNQFIADAMARNESGRYNQAAGQAIGALQGSGANIPAQSQLGNLGGVLRSLMVLQQLRRGGASPGITDFKGGSIDPAQYQNMTDYQPALSGLDLSGI